MIEVQSYVEVDYELVSIYDLDKDIIIETDPFYIDGKVDLLIDYDYLIKDYHVEIYVIWLFFVESIDSLCKNLKKSDIEPSWCNEIEILNNNKYTFDLLVRDYHGKLKSKTRLSKSDWLNVLYPAAIDFFRIMARVNSKYEEDHRQELRKLNSLRPLVYPRDYWTSGSKI